MGLVRTPWLSLSAFCFPGGWDSGTAVSKGLGSPTDPGNPRSVSSGPDGPLKLPASLFPSGV